MILYSISIIYLSTQMSPAKNALTNKIVYMYMITNLYVSFDGSCRVFVVVDFFLSVTGKNNCNLQAEVFSKQSKRLILGNVSIGL